MMLRSAALAVALLFVAAPSILPGQATPFAERFALAPDRKALLDELVPGTVQHYYWSCLERQHAGDLTTVDALLAAWAERRGRGRLFRQIENRQALLAFGVDPDRTWKHLTQLFGLRFDATADTEAVREGIPSRLDPDELSSRAWFERALQADPRLLRRLRQPALVRLAATDLDMRRLRALLARLTRIDVRNLPALIVRELQDERSQGFESLGIHRRLTLDQLEECARLLPALLENEKFVRAIARRLAPRDGLVIEHAPEERRAHLERLQRLTDRLSPLFNSMKAQVLQARLRFDRERGTHDLTRFLAYLRLPQRAPWTAPGRLEDLPGRFLARSGRQELNGVRAHEDGTTFVRSLLMHHFRSGVQRETFRPLIREEWLDRVWAEAMILSGQGDPEELASRLGDAAAFEALRDRITLRFAPDLPRTFGENEAVNLALDVKNVPELLVRVYQVDTLAWYRERGTEVDASLAIDGLVPGVERRFRYEQSPFIETRREYAVPEALGPGTWIVEFIGNGLSSRAVVRKGSLRHRVRTGGVGHVFHVIDEQGNVLQDAFVHVDGQRFEPDEDGAILVPFSTAPGQKQVMLEAGARVALVPFDHQRESFQLSLDLHAPREGLVAGSDARLIARPLLRINGEVASLQRLEDVRITVRGMTGSGTEIALDVPTPRLSLEEEMVIPVGIPDDLRTLQLELEARILSAVSGKRVTRTVKSDRISLNDIAAAGGVTSPFLERGSDGYHLFLRGRNGEPRQGLQARVTIRHEDYDTPLQKTLRTDAEGGLHLGPLEGARDLTVRWSESEARWNLRTASASYPRTLNLRADETRRLPRMRAGSSDGLRPATLLEMRGRHPARDRTDLLRSEDAFHVLSGLTPGSYSLRLHEEGVSIAIQVEAGPRSDDTVLGPHRTLGRSAPTALRMVRPTIGADTVTIGLAGFTSRTRVHVFAMRSWPMAPAHEALRTWMRRAEVTDQETFEAIYASGRVIGDEFRYILDRRAARKFPGNMLTRPGLLVNPWAEQEADSTRRMDGGFGGQFGGRGAGRRGGRAGGGRAGGSDVESAYAWVATDFVANPARVLANLRPDEDGLIRIPRADLAGQQMIEVVAIDGAQTLSRRAALDRVPLARRDRRLSEGFPLDRALAKQRRVTLVKAGSTAEGSTDGESSFLVYDSLRSVYEALVATGRGQALTRFAFLLEWPGLEDARKKELWSQHACHELHVFLHEKDPEFFRTVVRPTLATKIEKDFLDHWLLEQGLERFLAPAAFARLNTFERLLLVRRTRDAAAAGRLAEDLQALVPLAFGAEDAVLFSLLAKDALGTGGGRGGRFRGAPADFAGGGPGGGVAPPTSAAAPSPELSAGRPSARRSRRGFPGEGAANQPQGGGGGGLPSRNGVDERARKRSASEDRRLAEEIVEEEEMEEEPDADEFLGGERSKLRAEALELEKLLEREQGDLDKDLARLGQMTASYRAPDPTRRHVEHRWWQRSFDVDTTRDLIDINPFWIDFAKHGGDAPFVSTHFASAASSVNEMLLVLALLDLPFTSADHGLQQADGRWSLTARHDLLIVREDLVTRSFEAEPNRPRVLVRQRLLARGARTDDTVPEIPVEIVRGRILDFEVALTNPTSTPGNFRVLLQIPTGAIALDGRPATRSEAVRLPPAGTWKTRVAIVFPESGSFAHYPAQIAEDTSVVARGPARTLSVLEAPEAIDRASWQWISQSAPAEDVLTFLAEGKVREVPLARLAWRMKDADFFAQATAALSSRMAYDPTLWSYAFLHGDGTRAREFLEARGDLESHFGMSFRSGLLAVNPRDRRSYEHVDYRPLFNSRAHRLGRTRKIENRELEQSWMQLVNMLSQQTTLDARDWMSVTYYLLLQDRVEEALEAFAKVDRTSLGADLQHDAMQAYLAFFTEEYELARTIAKRHEDHPATHWRQRFQEMLAHLDEAEGASIRVVDEEDREQQITASAAATPALELTMVDGAIRLEHANLKGCELAFHEMDLEFLFSSRPFAARASDASLFVEPNLAQEVRFAADTRATTVPLPERYGRANVVIEARGAGITRRAVHYANGLAVRVNERFGQVEVGRKSDGKPVRKTYVKVYVRMRDGRVRFHKDGYTDLRGRFDYASVSGKNLANVERFAILVLDEQLGGEVREVRPPLR